MAGTDQEEVTSSVPCTTRESNIENQDNCKVTTPNPGRVENLEPHVEEQKNEVRPSADESTPPNQQYKNINSENINNNDRGHSHQDMNYNNYNNSTSYKSSYNNSHYHDNYNAQSYGQSMNSANNYTPTNSTNQRTDSYNYNNYSSSNNQYPGQKRRSTDKESSLNSFYGDSWDRYNNPPEKDFLDDTSNPYRDPEGKDRWSRYDEYQGRCNDKHPSSTGRNNDTYRDPDSTYMNNRGSQYEERYYGEPSRERKQPRYSEELPPRKPLESHALKSFFGSSLDTYYNPPENDYIGNLSADKRYDDKHDDIRDNYYQQQEELAEYEASRMNLNQDTNNDTNYTPNNSYTAKRIDYKSEESKNGLTEEDFWNNPPDNLMASPPDDSDEEEKTKASVVPDEVENVPFRDDKEVIQSQYDNNEVYREEKCDRRFGKDHYEEEEEEETTNYEEEYRSYFQSRYDNSNENENDKKHNSYSDHSESSGYGSHASSGDGGYRESNPSNSSQNYSDSGQYDDYSTYQNYNQNYSY